MTGGGRHWGRYTAAYSVSSGRNPWACLRHLALVRLVPKLCMALSALTHPISTTTISQNCLVYANKNQGYGYLEVTYQLEPLSLCHGTSRGPILIADSKGLAALQTLCCWFCSSVLQNTLLPSVEQYECMVSEVSLIILLDFNGIHRLFRINEAKVLNQEAI